jgi:hypothetical protein
LCTAQRFARCCEENRFMSLIADWLREGDAPPALPKVAATRSGSRRGDHAGSGDAARQRMRGASGFHRCMRFHMRAALPRALGRCGDRFRLVYCV